MFDRCTIDGRQISDSVSIHVQQRFDTIVGRFSVDVQSVSDRFSIGFQYTSHRFPVDVPLFSVGSQQMFDRCSIDGR